MRVPPTRVPPTLPPPWTPPTRRSRTSPTVVPRPGSATGSGPYTVTLPAAHLARRYAHDHVRLGYAATEHGYQSDTVDHSLALISAATTRRGLYVAATRGRHDNLLYVVTDSDDVAEATDTLEMILAFDRADIPAVAQRRTLAHQVPLEAARQQPLPTSRREIPEWFEPLLADLRSGLKAAEQAVTDSEIGRTRLAASVAAAERDLARIEATTAAAREQLAAATGRVDQARWQHTDAQRRLDVTGWRRRRAARRELAAAEVRRQRAVEHLQRTRHRTRPDIDQYNQARARLESAQTTLDRHDIRARLRHTVDQVPLLRRQIEALELWSRWARRDTINGQQLADTIAQLTNQTRRGEHADQFRALGQAARQWADDAGIDLPNRGRHTRTPERAGPELGL